MASPIELKLSRYTNGDYTLNGAEITLLHTYNPKQGNGVDDITESIPLQLEGSKATVRATINSINDFLASARRREEGGYGDIVYLMTRTGGTAESWRRSIIKDGKLSVTDDGIIAGLNSGDRTSASLTITRDGYFDDLTYRSVEFYNANGTTLPRPDDDPINLYNCNSGSGTAPTKLQNYAIVDAADIVGDLPAPISLLIGNSAGSIDKYYVSVTTPYEGTATPSYYFYDFSGTADASCSGGSAASYTLSTAAEADMFSATMTGGPLFQQLGGAPYHVIARFRNNTSLGNVRFRLKIKNGAATIWTGQQFMLPNTDIMQDLGVVNLPPGLPYSFGSGVLVISGTRTTGSSETIGLDYIQLFGGDYAELQGLATSDAGHYVNFGGRNKVISRMGAASMPYLDWIAYGSSTLMLRPGKDNMLQVVSQTSTAGTAEIDHLNSISATYYPRWSSPL